MYFEKYQWWIIKIYFILIIEKNIISFIILVIDILIYFNLDYAGVHLCLIKITLFTMVNKTSLLNYSGYVDIAKKG